MSLIYDVQGGGERDVTVQKSAWEGGRISIYLSQMRR